MIRRETIFRSSSNERRQCAKGDNSPSNRSNHDSSVGVGVSVSFGRKDVVYG